MIKKMAALFFILLATLTSIDSPAQIQRGNALFEHLTVEEGLSSNGVNCIFQDSRGFIWIGTGNGLNRYDGVEIVQYFHKKDNNSIAGNVISSICEDKLHNLWIGTNDGVSYFEPDKNRFTNYLTNTAKTGKLKPGFYYAGLDHEDNLWVSSNFNLSKFDKRKKEFTHYKIDNGENLPITRNYYVRSIFQDSKKRIWVPTSYGVKLFNQAAGQFTSFLFPETDKAAPENFVVSIKETASKKIIASTWGGSLLIFNEAGGKFEKMILYEEPMPRKNLINIVLDILPANGKLYCATSEGLVVLDETDIRPGVCRRFTQYTHSDANQKSINSNIVTFLWMDNTGTLWIATRGISKMDPLKQQFKNDFLTYNNIPLQVNCTAIYDGKIVLGALDAFFLEDGQIKPFGLTPKLKSDFGEQVWNIYSGKQYLWLATTNGLVQTTKDGKFIKQYSFQKNKRNSIAGERLWKVYEDSKGLVWMGSVRRGISILDPANGTIRNYFSDKEAKNSLFNKYVSSFFEDKDANIWFTAGDGLLYRYNRVTDSFSVTRLILEDGTEITSVPEIIQQETDGSLILSSAQEILQFDSRTNKPHVIASDNNMVNAYDAIADTRGNYWIATGTGLLHYNTKTKTFKRYTTQNGLPSNEDINGIKLLPDGRIIIAGTGFISFFDPAELGNDKNIPPVRITKVLANSKDSLYPDISNKLPYLSGVEFHYAALGYSNADQNMYKYRLTGIDNNWSQPTFQRSVSYAQLPPGHYTFEVMGSNAAGVWNDKPAAFSFSIKRPFYKAWWFYVLLASMACLIIFAFYRYRLRKAIELEKMRTRIATDLHDDIGATLSSISMYSESLKQQVKDKLPHLEPVLNKMGENSREMVAGMSDIVWAIKPGNDTGDKLIHRMEDYATDICAAKNIRLHFESEERTKQLPLSLEQRRNVYLVFKEALNNAVKYSGAANVWVKIGEKNKCIHLVIKDDGCGFDLKKISGGNGLDNMRQRAAEIKAVLEIRSGVGQGTHIELDPGG